MQFLRSWISWSIFGLRFGWWQLRHAARDRAIILVRQGVYYDLELAYSLYRAKEGVLYAFGDSGIAYALEGPMMDRAKAHNRDPFEVFEDERVLFQVDGEVVTCPVIGTGVRMEDTALSDFNRGDTVHQALQSISGQSRGFGGSWKLLLAIAAIAIIVYVVYKFVLHGHIPGTPVTPVLTPTPTPTPTPGPVGPIFTEWLYWLVSNA